jgi:hypothetical protein
MTVKTFARTLAASLLLVAVAACSSLPQPQTASAGIASQNLVEQGN